jgi:Sec-independent protein translocase protein TatA
VAGSSTRTNLISFLGLVFLVAVLVLTPEARHLSSRLADWIQGVKKERAEFRQRQEEQQRKEREKATEEEAAESPPAAEEEAPELPPHVVLAADGTLVPEPGYRWLNDNPMDKGVEWSPGAVHPGNPHVVASPVPGQWVPEAGYEWVEAEGPVDRRVAWVPGKHHPDNEHVIAAEKEREWYPAPGYKWANDAPGDLTVVPESAPAGGSGGI